LTGGAGTIGSTDSSGNVTVLVACGIERVRQRGDQLLCGQMLVTKNP
jgi:hypothetical protein